jgi:hypothetical protein
MAAGNFSDVTATKLTDQERELLQAAAKEFVENSEVEGFAFLGEDLNTAAPWVQQNPWSGGREIPTFSALQAATDYMGGTGQSFGR